MLSTGANSFTDSGLSSDILVPTLEIVLEKIQPQGVQEQHEPESELNLNQI